MNILINIPKEFEQHFQADRFEDSLHRLSADAHLLAGNYEQETVVMLIESFKSAVPVPSHGRLIDADALEVDDGWLDNQDGTQTHIQFVYANDIINAPAIIEAEEGETQNEL